MGPKEYQRLSCLVTVPRKVNTVSIRSSVASLSIGGEINTTGDGSRDTSTIRMGKISAGKNNLIRI